MKELEVMPKSRSHAPKVIPSSTRTPTAKPVIFTSPDHEARIMRRRWLFRSRRRCLFLGRLGGAHTSCHGAVRAIH